jgi:protein-tyrosine phosphatase
MGVSRSATVCIAYLMQYHNRTHQAYIHLKQRRPSIDPNEGFWYNLAMASGGKWHNNNESYHYSYYYYSC